MKRILHLILYIAFAILPIHAQNWKAGTIVDDEKVKSEQLDKWFSAEEISDEVLARMLGKSYPENCATPLSSLRYLKLIHRNKEGKTQRGELVCNKAIASDLLQVFRTLYESDYVIERMMLVDEYDASDEKSMTANNTSCFNFRFVSGTRTISKHGLGLAIDINPLYNPCLSIRSGKVEPAAGKPYAKNRTGKRKHPQMIDKQDLAYRLLIQHGFRWGGNWKSKKDWQHFEK